jgi:hypothetical protein
MLCVLGIPTVLVLGVSFGALVACSTTCQLIGPAP